MNPQNKITIFKDPAALAIGAAELLIKVAHQAIETNGRFVLVLSGGTTPQNLYKLLATPKYSNQILWDKTFIFWGDERFVSTDDQSNNAHMAKHLLLDFIANPPQNVFPIPVNSTPKESAEAYENTIKTFFGNQPARFDLIILGLGENGHTASLFPDTDVVFEKTRLVKEVYVGEQQMFRITMTALLINAARNIVFLVEGENKAAVLNTILNGPQDLNQFPAQIVNPNDGNVYWLIDANAAAVLQSQNEQNG